MPKWLDIETFADKYDVRTNHVYQLRHKGLLPSTAFKHFSDKKRKRYYIDESYVLRRKAFQKEVQLYCHDMYFLLSAHFPVVEIVEDIARYYNILPGSMNVFLSSTLFNHKTNFLSWELTHYEWVFFKYCRRIERRLKKLYGPNFSVAYILDRRSCS